MSSLIEKYATYETGINLLKLPLQSFPDNLVNTCAFAISATALKYFTSISYTSAALVGLAAFSFTYLYQKDKQTEKELLYAKKIAEITKDIQSLEGIDTDANLAKIIKLYLNLPKNKIEKLLNPFNSESKKIFNLLQHYNVSLDSFIQIYQKDPNLNDFSINERIKNFINFVSDNELKAELEKKEETAEKK